MEQSHSHTYTLHCFERVSLKCPSEQEPPFRQQKLQNHIRHSYAVFTCFSKNKIILGAWNLTKTSKRSSFGSLTCKPLKNQLSSNQARKLQAAINAVNGRDQATPNLSISKNQKPSNSIHKLKPKLISSINQYLITVGFKAKSKRGVELRAQKLVKNLRAGEDGEKRCHEVPLHCR